MSHITCDIVNNDMGAVLKHVVNIFNVFAMGATRLVICNGSKWCATGELWCLQLPCFSWSWRNWYLNCWVAPFPIYCTVLQYLTRFHLTYIINHHVWSLRNSWASC